MTTVAKMTRLVAYVSGAVGQDPLFDADQPWWEVLSVHHEIGGVMEAILKYDLAQEDTERRIQDWNLFDFEGKRVEIFSLVPDGEDAGERDYALFRGELVEEIAEISVPNESKVYRATLKPARFGNRCRGAIVWLPPLDPEDEEDTGRLFETSNHLFFNPTVDGVQRSNMDLTHTGYWPHIDEPGEGDPENLFYPLVDPESALSDAAEEALEFTVPPQPWPMSHVVAYFLWSLNNEEEFVKNPLNPTDDSEPTTRSEAADIVDAYLQDAYDQPENLKLPRGQFLPYYLNQVLSQYGCMWAVDASHDINDENSHVELRIRLFVRGLAPTEDDEKVLYLDEIESAVDVSNMEDLKFTTSLEQMPSAVYAEGSFKEYEITIPLYSVESDKLWVANEGWDYAGLDKPNLNVGFGTSPEFVVRRRVAQDCLTTYTDEETHKPTRRPPFPEYNDGGEWKEIPQEWGYRVLPDQIGIRFHTAPPELAGAEVRLTCTVQSDVRLSSISDNLNTLQVDHNEAYVDLSDQCHYRQRVTAALYPDTEFASVLSGDADTVDDESKMEGLLLDMRKNCQTLPVFGAVTLFGLNFDYKVGDVITEITGRTTDFMVLNSGGRQYYPQITGITWDHLNQRTRLDFAPTKTPEVAG
jgi:hypothetical protein